MAISAVQLFRRALWFVFRPETTGVDAIALTPHGKIVLVKLNYANGWRLPGGGCRRRETAKEAIERELEEEIGLKSRGNLQQIAQYSHIKHYKNETIHVFIVDNVQYCPRWSIEIAAVREFAPYALPADAKHAQSWINKARAMGHIA